MATEPKLYSKNYVHKNCTFTFSSASAMGFRICDKDKNSKWISSGQNSDATEASVDVIFIEGGNEVEKEIDTIMLVNHNLEDPIAEYWNGSSWQSFDSETNLTDGTCTILTVVSPVTTSRIRIRGSETITTNEEKYIGELIACLLLVDFAKELMGYTPNLSNRKAFEITLADGSIHRTVVMSSLYRSAKYEAKCRFDFLSQDEIEELQTIKESAQQLTWQPESITRPDEVYQVNWVGGFAAVYVSSYKGAGYRLDMDLKEV